ncbi:MAG: carboxymuconolactone decarboxylase family protein [Anaerolineaceae bacterium]|nr:carboxymuconolactone decarboxylase family protein [Anaerolineaceae bacterium]
MKLPSDKSAHQDIMAIDPDFGRMAVQVGSEVWGLAELSPKECAFLCLTADVCHQILDLPFQLHLDMALANGASRAEVKELLLHLAPYAGYPSTLRAMVRLKEIYAAFDQHAQPAATATPVPAQPEPFIMSDGTQNALLALDPHFGDFAIRQMSQVWSRSGLTPQERAYLSLAVDVCYQTLDGPFQFHLKQALACGVSGDQIKAVLRFMAEFSLPKAWSAFIALDTFLAELNH